MVLKSIIRKLLKGFLPSTQPPILVASMGRTGSTLIYASLVEGMVVKRFGIRSPRLGGLVRETAWRLCGASYRNGRVYKTHDFPEGLKPGERPLVVFLYGSASDAARSVLRCDTVYGCDWIKEHLEHLRAKGAFEDIPDRDVLRFGEQLDAWLSCEIVPVLALRYEDLWTSGAEQKLSRFVGFPVRLPVRRARESTGMELGETSGKLMATYAELDARVAALPAVLTNDRAKARLEMARGPR